MRRQIRGISDELWADYEQACKEVNGSADRSDDIRKHVEAVVAEWKRRRAEKTNG